MEEKLKNLEALLEEAKQEYAIKKEAEDERKRKLEEARTQKEKEQEQKKQKLERKKKLEAKWEMLRWITMYINKNKEAWRKEKEDRDEINLEKVKEWEKMERFAKIIKLKEKIRRNKSTIYEENTNPNKSPDFDKYREEETRIEPENPELALPTDVEIQ